VYFLRFHLFLAVFFMAPGCVSAPGKLAYYSDYFSFIGGDAVGFVTFALDNNRGVGGADYQAEHFGVLYDVNSGWVKLLGMDTYENVRGGLKRIPNSPHVAFNGLPEAGRVVISDDNALSLEIVLLVDLPKPDH
jgi:hypothetical protein